MAPKAAAFRKGDRPVLPARLPVQSVHQADGIGIPIRYAAFPTTLTHPPRNALRGGFGIVTSVSHSQPLRLPRTLNLLSTIVVVVGSEPRSFTPRPRVWDNELRSRSLHNRGRFIPPLYPPCRLTRDFWLNGLLRSFCVQTLPV